MKLRGKRPGDETNGENYFGVVDVMPWVHFEAHTPDGTPRDKKLYAHTLGASLHGEGTVSHSELL